MDRFTASDHNTAEQHLLNDPGAMVIIGTVGGNTFGLASLSPFIAGTAIGCEPDGSLVKVYAENIESITLVPAASVAANPPVDDAYMQDWQRLHLALRAACDKSNDPEVYSAAAALNALEAKST